MDDNLADDNISAELPGAIQPVDQYMNLFDEIETSTAAMNVLVDDFKTQPHDQARLYQVIRFIENQQRLNEKLHELLVDMNNLFA